MTRRDIRFDEPLYTVAEAARMIAVPPSTLATWTRGYLRDRAGRSPVIGEAVVTAFPAEGRSPSIPFVGLAEAVVLAAVRRSGVPMQRVRPALAALELEMHLRHALASQRLYSDGAEILYDFSADQVDETRFASYLYTAGQPDPDLLIRTSGEMRVSNFLLWQIAYAEIWVTDTLWPDFRQRHLLEAIVAYQKRDRRYGGINQPAVAGR